MSTPRTPLSPGRAGGVGRGLDRAGLEAAFLTVTASGAYVSQWSAGSSALSMVATDAAGNVYATDIILNRVQKFGVYAVSVEAASWGRVKERFR